MPYFRTDSGKQIEITREQVLEGMRKFDEMAEKDDDLSRTGTIWFVENDGKRYPPKWVLSLATGVPRNEFGGGENSNRPLRELQFHVDRVEPIKEPEVVDAIKTTFTIERDLHHALQANIEQLEPGLKVTGSEVKVPPAGRLDILAVDRNGNTVVIELKAGEADWNAIGQILAYMGDLRRDGKTPRGILVAGDFTPRLISAASAVPSIELKKYSFNFSFQLVKQPS